MAVSLQQARQELNQASGGSNNNEWLNSRSDDEVRSEYKKLTGNDVEGTSSGTGGNPVGGDVAGGYGFLPFLLQLLQGAIQSGQFQQNFGENQRQFNETLANLQNQFGQNLNLQTGNLTGYLPTGALPRGGYDEAVNWYNRFKQTAGRAPTREEWISGVANTLNITTPAAAHIYDQGIVSGTAPGGGGSPTHRIPTRQEFADLLGQAISRYPGNPSLQRQQFESQLALQLANMDRTNPYAARQARLGLQPGLEQGAEDIFRRLQGGGGIPQYGQPPVNRVGIDPLLPGEYPVPPPRSESEDLGRVEPSGLPGGPRRDWHIETDAQGGRWIVNDRTGVREPDTLARAMGVPNPSPISTAPLSSANIPLQGQMIQYGQLRNLLPSELETVATDLRAKGINPEDYFATSRRAQPTGLTAIGSTRYI